MLSKLLKIFFISVLFAVPCLAQPTTTAIATATVESQELDQPSQVLTTVDSELNVIRVVIGGVVLVLLLASSALGGTGDIVSVTVRADGWSVDVVQEGDCTAGTYDFGLAANNVPGAGTPYLTVVSQGYNASAQLGTITRTVYLTQRVRKPYPDHATLDATYSAPNTTTRVALSDFVYDDDESGAGKSGTDVTVTIPEGWCNAGGRDNTAVSAGAVTNDSTLDYPKVVGNWAWPGYSHVGATVDLEFVAFHRFAQNAKPVACVILDVTDAHTNNVSQTVTAMTLSARNASSASGLKVSSYAASLSTTALTQGDTLTARARAYPWVGDADSVLDTGDGVNTAPTPKYAPQYYVCDKNGAYGAFAVVDGASTEANKSCYTTQAAAESAHTGDANTAYSSIANALTALQTYHNANYGHNDAGGGTVLLVEGTHTLNSTAGGTNTMWATIQPKTGAAKANTILQPGTTNADALRRLKVSGLTFSGTGYFRAYDTNMLWIHGCACNTTGALTIWQTPASYCTDSSGVLAGWFTSFSTSRSDWAIVRGVTIPGITYGYCVLGCQGVTYALRNSGSSMQDGGVFAWNVRYADNNASPMVLAFETENMAHGFALVGNVLESVAATTPAVQISADSSTSTTNHCLLWHNTVAGQRCNLGYNEAGTTSYPQNNWSQKFNSLRDWNNKDDGFAPESGNRVGSWPVGYGVGFRGNRYEIATFAGEFGGLDYALAGDDGIAYVDNASGTGDNSGNGDYTPANGSVLIDRVPSGGAVIPYDLNGHVISNAGGGEAGAIMLLTAPVATITSDDPQNATEGDTVTLTGTGTDAEDGTLSGASLAWSSDLDGALGTGASLAVSTLTVGTHTITLTVTDAEGATHTDTCQVVVSAAGGSYIRLGDIMTGWMQDFNGNING